MILLDEVLYLAFVRQEVQLVYRIIEVRLVDDFGIYLLHQLLLFTVEIVQTHALILLPLTAVSCVNPPNCIIFRYISYIIRLYIQKYNLHPL